MEEESWVLWLGVLTSDTGRFILRKVRQLSKHGRVPGVGYLVGASDVYYPDESFQNSLSYQGRGLSQP